MQQLLNLQNLPISSASSASTFDEDLDQDYDPDEYRLGSGLVVIFNQRIYEDPELEARVGTNKDVNELVLTFGRLGFDIDERYIFNNLTRGGVIDNVKKLSQEVDHTDRSFLIVVVLTHGGEDNLLYTEDTIIYAYEIWEPFFSSTCPSLKGKPKFFIFQACKGSNFVTGTTNTSPVISETIFHKPLEDDILISFSNVEGGKSLRHVRHGTWFIQELCRNFNTFGRRDDVVSLLLRVSKCVASNYYHIENDKKTAKEIVVKQMPLFISTLSKKFYLCKSKYRCVLMDLQEQQQEILDAIANI